MSVSAHAHRLPAARPRPSAAISRWSASAWGAIAVTTTFIALTCWWLTQDRSIPVYDAGWHLETAIEYHRMLQSGNLLGPFNNVLQYPPLAFLVGALAMFVGGVNVSTPIIAENLVFVSLLALGCYQTGRLVFGHRAGLLAVIFVLGSPLLIAEFHVFMLDAPETALVAVAIWLLLASEDFSRTRIAALAGLAVGCGVNVKVTFPFFVVGIILVALARGGWRNWRGLAAFVGVVLLIGAPWYLDHLSEFSEITRLAGAAEGSAPGNIPKVFSTANLLWYFWSTLNSQLLAPLFLLALGGSVWTILAVARGRDAGGMRLALLTGAFAAWLAITLTRHHDIRYDMPLMPYLAVIGTGWIVHLSRVPRLAATGVLVLAVVANTLGTTFGVGGQVETTLVRSPPATEAFPDRIVFYSNVGFLVAGPKRDGDVPGLLQALRPTGVREVTWLLKQSQGPDFSSEGLRPLAMIAGMSPGLATNLEATGVNTSSTIVALIHQSALPGEPPACARLSDGTGVWVLRRNPASGKIQAFCPFLHPHYYPY